MAKKGKKRSKGRKSGRLTRKEIKRAGGIKQAWAARRGKTKSPRKASRKSRKTSHKAPKRSKGRKSRKGSKRGHGRSSSRSSSRSNTRIVKSTIVRHLPGHTVAVTPVPSASRGKRRGSRKSRRKGRKHGRRKSRKGQFKRGGGRRAREGYAMENPLSAMELAVGLFTGALGFGVSDFVDRYVATHALTDKGSKDAAGNELYADTPATTGGASGYQGLFNGTAVLAPMNLTRWGVGVGIAAVPFVAAAFVKAPAGRSALQMFGFGAALRTVGKGLTDLVAMVSTKTAVGQRLYDDRQRAAALRQEASGGTPTIASASLPSSGLGAPPVACKGCGKTGMGACCSSCATRSQQESQPQNAPPPPPPPPQNLVPPPVATQSLTGVLANGVAAPAFTKKNIHNWGNESQE